jgi:hypothetical protein
MALKIAQVVPTLAVVSGVTTSTAFELTSGYLRLTSSVGCNVVVGSNPSASTNDFYLAPNESEIIKEKVARQKIVGITTGSSTIINLGHNNGNPFVVGDYVTIAGSIGINTSHNQVTAIAENIANTTITINYNSSAVGVPTITSAYVSKSVKVSAAATTSGSLYITEVQIASQA